MNFDKFMKLLTDSGQRAHFIGDSDFGAVAALDREGRIFTVIEGEVVSRVNETALAGVSTRKLYLNPGGDVLWPAPEGTCFGYEYSTGEWRVPPGITGAGYMVIASKESGAVIEAEVDLINSMGIGIPCLFRRAVALEADAGVMEVEESITYIGSRTLRGDEFRLAPWSLSQFDNSPGAEVLFPDENKEVRDLYEPSDAQRSMEGGVCRAWTNPSVRYQIAMGERTDWIEFRDPAKKLLVRRTADKIAAGLEYIDIIDAPPETCAQGAGVRFSVYNDTGGFMEIEAAGGSFPELEQGACSSVRVYTKFKKLA